MKQPTDAVPPDIALRRGESEFAITIPGPVDHEGFPPQIGHINEFPETAVVAFIAVVPHHEKAVNWNFDRNHIVSWTGAEWQNSVVAVNNVWFRKRLIVDKHLLVLNPDGISWQANHPLNEVF